MQKSGNHKLGVLLGSTEFCFVVVDILEIGVHAWDVVCS